MKWIMVGATVSLSVVTLGGTCHCLRGASWWDWLVFLANATLWQGLGIYAWQYWTARRI